jgi:Xaa-Pro dipeptidase
MGYCQWLTACSIEDNLVITKDGSQNLTTTLRDADQIEKVISSS